MILTSYTVFSTFAIKFDLDDLAGLCSLAALEDVFHGQDLAAFA